MGKTWWLDLALNGSELATHRKGGSIGDEACGMAAQTGGKKSNRPMCRLGRDRMKVVGPDIWIRRRR